MNLSASAAAWHLPAKPTARGRRFLKAMAIGLAAIVIAQYLAGWFFLWSLRDNPRDASPLTNARYGYYYGERAAVRSRLIVSSAAGFGLVLASALVALFCRAAARCTEMQALPPAARLPPPAYWGSTASS